MPIPASCFGTPTVLSLDLDGVLFDPMTPTYLAIQQAFDVVIGPDDVTGYDVASGLLLALNRRYPDGWPRRFRRLRLVDWLKRLWLETPGFMRSAYVHWPIWAAAHRALARGLSVHIVSSRFQQGQLVREETLAALRATGLLRSPGRPSVRVHSGASRSKLQHLLQLQARCQRRDFHLVHVEDCAAEAEVYSRKGVDVRLIERPWNKVASSPRLTESQVATAIAGMHP